MNEANEIRVLFLNDNMEFVVGLSKRKKQTIICEATLLEFEVSDAAKQTSSDSLPRQRMDGGPERS